MRILYLCAGTHSGIVTFQAQAMRDHGAEVSVVNVAEDFNYRMRRAKLPSPRPSNAWNSILALAKWGREWRWHFGRTDFAFRLLSSRAKRFWLTHEERFDVVIQSGAMWNAVPATRRIPFTIHTDHTYAISKRYLPVDGLPLSADASSDWEQMERACYHAADLIFPMSAYVSNSLQSDYGVPERRIVVTGGGPNLEVPRDCKLLKTEEKNILFVGKDFPRKGGDVLLDAFQEVRRQIPSARLTVVGPSKPVLGDGVDWRGSLSHLEMASVYGMSRLFVLPSLREPYGISFLEAMAYGLPCIGTRIEAIPEIVDNGRTGILVPSGDAPALAKALLLLLEDDEMSRRMGSAGYERVVERLNWKSVTGRMLDRLERLLTNWNPRA